MISAQNHTRKRPNQIAQPRNVGHNFFETTPDSFRSQRGVLGSCSPTAHPRSADGPVLPWRCRVGQGCFEPGEAMGWWWISGGNLCWGEAGEENYINVVA